MKILARLRDFLFGPSLDAMLADPVQVAGRTAWGEARGGGTLGMHAVLCSIGNRAKQPGWWGRTILTVCLARGQYDCWTPGSEDHAAMLAVSAGDPEFRTALALAQQLVDGTLTDITGGADSYYALGSRRPEWAIGVRYRGTWGGQAFYRVGVAGLGVPLSDALTLTADDLAGAGT